MKVNCVWEHNGQDTLLYLVDDVGAYVRGESLSAALAKLPAELAAYRRWSGGPACELPEIELVQEKASTLTICDADSDVLLESERAPLTAEEYTRLKTLVLRSAQDFLALYDAIPDKNAAARPARRSFYGPVPRTAAQMYEHTKNVNAYYFSEIGVDADNDGSIYDCRARGFAALEKQPDYLQNPVFQGSYDEAWSLRKVLRRFIWHDRIHAKAMYRLAVQLFGAAAVLNPFCF